MRERRSRVQLLFFVLCYSLSVGLIVIEAVHMGMDSDRANHLLQAQDIVRGNLFLSDWNLTRAHFLTTDLVAYLIGYLAGGGLGYPAVVIAYSLMYAALLAVTMIAALKDGPVRFSGDDQLGRLFALSLILYLCIPCRYLMAVGRIHVIAYVYCIAAFILASDILKGIPACPGKDGVSGGADRTGNKEDKSRRKRLAGLTLLLTVGSFGDFLVFLYAAVPILLYVSVLLLQIKKAARTEDGGTRRFRMFSSPSERERARSVAEDPGSEEKTSGGSETAKVCRQLAIRAALSLPLSCLADRMYYAIGGANRNGSIFRIRFSDPRIWGERCAALFGAILRFAEGGSGEGGGLSFDTFLRLSNAALVVVSLGLLVAVILRFVSEKETDPVSVLLAVSALVAAATFIFTERSEERYLELVSAGLLIIFIRNADMVVRRSGKAPILRIVLIVLIYFALAGRTNEIVRGTQINAGMAAQLEAQGARLERACEGRSCGNGYASFWNASVYTVLTHGKVSVRHIMRTYDGETGDIRMQMYCWFNKNEWYAAPADFVLIDDRMELQGDSDEFGVSEMSCIRVFGEPAERIDLGDQLLLVYDHDISAGLTR